MPVRCKGYERHHTRARRGVISRPGGQEDHNFDHRFDHWRNCNRAISRYPALRRAAALIPASSLEHVPAARPLRKALHLLPGMGWGLPNSPGHYVDLFSAVSGIVLLLLA
jgi:hypothetical protein